MNIKKALSSPDFLSGKLWARPICPTWRGVAITLESPTESDPRWEFFVVAPQGPKPVFWQPYWQDLTDEWELVQSELVLAENERP